MSGATVPPHALDATDRLLVEALLADGRQSHRQLAARTGLGLTTVSRRVHRLEAAGVLRGYTAVADPEALGWSLTAIIGLQIDKGHLRTVQAGIAQDPRVFGVYDVTGEWDGVVLARCRDRQDLDDLAKTTLSAEHIQRTYTMVVLKTVHEDALVRAPPPAAPA